VYPDKMHIFVKHLLREYDTSRDWGAYNPHGFYTSRAELV